MIYLATLGLSTLECSIREEKKKLRGGSRGVRKRKQEESEEYLWFHGGEVTRTQDDPSLQFIQRGIALIL